jgi:two-component system cell cycle sensor histidine kinase PleC
MFREKLTKTVLWSAIPVAGAMLIDYFITVVLLRNYPGYTPFTTLIIATIVAFPTAYVLVSGRLNLKHARDELERARDAADAGTREIAKALRAADISRLKAEQERAAAVTANLAKSQFLANMSHELRTPLNAILGFSEMLALDRFADRRVEYARLIHGSGTHLLGLINDVLDLSKIEAGKIELHDGIVDIGALLSECATIFEPRAAGTGIALLRSIEAGLPDARGDERALKQIVLNLLSNALKFTRAGGEVEVFAYLSQAGELAFGVTDNGVGIAQDDQLRVFESFGQGRHDVTYSEKGTGLGLPIVKGLAEAHGGRVSLESQLGEGTCITVRLPRERLRSRGRALAAQ